MQTQALTPFDRGHDEIDSFRAELLASSFRARREAVYPGVILLLRGGSLCLHPAVTDRYTLGNEAILAMAMWGAQPPQSEGTLEPGTVNVGSDPVVRVPAVSCERLPTCGVPTFDCWIARANVLRQFAERRYKPLFGEVQLSPACFGAAIREVVIVLREQSASLLHRMPPTARDASLALASLIEAPKIESTALTHAIQELLVAAPRWREANSGKDATGWVDPDGATLVNSAGISDDTFRRIRNEAGISTKLRGAAARARRFSIPEIVSMIEVVRRGTYHRRAAIIDKWTKLINPE